MIGCTLDVYRYYTFDLNKYAAVPQLLRYYRSTCGSMLVYWYICIQSKGCLWLSGCHVSHRLRSNRVDVESTGTRSWMTSLLFLAVKKMMHPGILVERASLIPIAILIWKMKWMEDGDGDAMRTTDRSFSIRYQSYVIRVQEKWSKTQSNQQSTKLTYT